MQLKTNKNEINLYKTGLITFCCYAISACSFGNVSYISREEVKSVSFAQEKPRYLEKKPMSFGALRFTKKDAKPGEMGQVFLLQRKKSVYMAETKILDTGKKRYFLSLGVDTRSKAPAATFRMEF